MGWASGSELAESVWKAVRIFVPVEERKTVAVSIVRAFEDMTAIRLTRLRH